MSESLKFLIKREFAVINRYARHDPILDNRKRFGNQSYIMPVYTTN